MVSVLMKCISIYVSISTLVSISFASFVFNAEEFTNIHYDVDIVGEPKLTTELSSSGTSMTLLSKHGQRYECILPSNIYTLGNFALPSDESALKQKEIEVEDEKKLVSSVVYIPKLLDGMKDGPCLRLSKGWWEYELCFRQRIRQYHRNEQTGAVENEIVLGEYVSDFDWKSSEISTGFKKTGEGSSRQRGPRSHTQEYDQGTVCDLTGSPRRAQVVFQCDLTPHAMDALVDVEEPASCVYRLTVKTPRLCSNPLLRNAAEEQMPSRRRPPETIQCRPLLGPESMRRYKEVQAAKEAASRREAEAARLRAILQENRVQREFRIRRAIAAWLRGPLRRRKLVEMSRRRFNRLRTRLAVAEKAANVVETVLGSARRLSSRTEASIKAMSKRLKAKFKALKKQETKEGGKEDEENMEALRKVLSGLPEEVRKRLVSKEGKGTLRSGLSAQFQQMLEEAKVEVGSDSGDVNQRDMMGKMSEMIDKVLTQVDEASRRLDKETKLMDELSHRLKEDKKPADSNAAAEEQVPTVDQPFKKDKNIKKLKKREEETATVSDAKATSQATGSVAEATISDAETTSQTIGSVAEEKASSSTVADESSPLTSLGEDKTRPSGQVDDAVSGDIKSPSTAGEKTKSMSSEGHQPTFTSDDGKPTSSEGHQPTFTSEDGKPTSSEGHQPTFTSEDGKRTSSEGHQPTFTSEDGKPTSSEGQQPTSTSEDGKSTSTEEKSPMSSAEVEKMRGRLETELRQKMERRGFETSNVMLHVMTLGDREGEEGGKKDKPSFVGIIILKNDQQQREEERMRRLEKNYNFQIEETPPK